MSTPTAQRDQGVEKHASLNQGPGGFPERVHAVLPQIRERREEIEKTRRLPRDLVDELIATGLFRLGVPKAIGGDEAEPMDILRAIESSGPLKWLRRPMVRPAGARCLP
jgi:alkylation response protein AidB-like acyl-CoA dehydrogenase